MHGVVKFLVLSACFLALSAQAQEEPEAATDVVVEEAPVNAMPAGTALGLAATGYGSPVSSDRIAIGEIYGGRSGYVHPFLSVGGYHTDNLFRTENDEKSDWVAVITPGVWLSLPASQQKLLEINLLNTAPGGLAVDRFRTADERRLQGYALYRADIREHDRYQDENRVDHRGEAMLKIDLRGGLSLELVDVYEVNRDPYGTGGTPEREMDKYSANLVNVILAYQVSPKLMLRFDYGNYAIDYDAERNDFRDRSDNLYSAYVFYQVSPKTALFVQGEYIVIDYDSNANTDSEQMNYYLGLEFKATDKTRIRAKAGIGQKDYDDSSSDDRDDFLAEAQVDYAFTPKTSIYLRGLQRVLETDEAGARDILSIRFQLGYRQRIYAKLRAEAAVFFTHNNYDGTTTIGTQTGEREDDETGGVIALGYAPVDWSTFTVGYEYRERNSNFDTEDYRANTVFMRLNVAM
jgi:hypothetical protein